MSGCDSTPSKTRRNQQSPSFQAPPTFECTRRPLKKLQVRRRSAKSTLEVSRINDLPDFLLVEILCRLPCYKLVSQYHSVCKHWSTLMTSNPYFVQRFLLSTTSGHQQTPTIHTLINRSGYEFMKRMNSSTTKPLDPLFKELMRFHHLENEPIVVATYNDLVLCCSSQIGLRDYYICNPFTRQWYPLPRPPQFNQVYLIPVGFICDQPYYSLKKDDRGKHVVQINPEYRCIVLRLIFPYEENRPCLPCKEFKVQIFSSDRETDKWRELVVSCPSNFRFHCLNSEVSITLNGMLFWGGLYTGDIGRYFIGLDPLIMDNIIISSNGAHGDDTMPPPHYECRYIELEQDEDFIFIKCLGAFRGRLRMCDYNSETRELCVWDFDEEKLLRGGIVMLNGDDTMKVYSLKDEMMPDDEPMGNNVLGFDPDNDHIVYLQRHRDREIVKCDINNTGEWSRITGKRIFDYSFFYHLLIPAWPTPLPTIRTYYQPQ